MPKIKLLDLCCKAGGCSVGYFRAAEKLGLKIEITGVDIEPQPNYPFKFIKADAVKYLSKHGHRFTHIHASPPCQKYSRSTFIHRRLGKEYNDIMDELIEQLIIMQKPSVIENVPDSHVRPDIILRGDMFGLKVLRARYFQLENWYMLSPYMPQKIGSVRDGDYCSVFGKGSYTKNSKDSQPKFKKASVRETWKYAMGIDWMQKESELAEAIPPAYTEYIGMQFLKAKP